MGMRPTAHLFYGMLMPGYDEHFEEDIDFIKDAGYEEWWGYERGYKGKCPVTLVVYCHSDLPMYALAVAGTHLTADWDGAAEVSKLRISSESLRAATLWVEKNMPDYIGKWTEATWHLAAEYG